MIRSMTGYGAAERAVEQGSLRVEMKTVNHRFLNTSIRTPAGFDRFDTLIQGWVREHVTRGHVHVSISFESSPDAPDASLPELDLQRARRLKQLLGTLRSELGLGGEPDLAMIARFGDVFRAPAGTSPGEQIAEDVVRALVDAAGTDLVEMRRGEGDRLRADMEGRLDALDDHLDSLQSEAPRRLLDARDRLREAVRELTGQDDIDEDRLAREIAYLAEKWDVNEELVRLRAHVKLFRDTLAAPDDEPAGKRLAFVVQEMNREANTIGAKANDVQVQHTAVAMKEEVERLREQVENVE